MINKINKYCTIKCGLIIPVYILLWQVVILINITELNEDKIKFAKSDYLITGSGFAPGLNSYLYTPNESVKIKNDIKSKNKNSDELIECRNDIYNSNIIRELVRFDKGLKKENILLTKIFLRGPPRILS